MKPVAIALAALVATASSATAQEASVVYTNVVDGQRVDRIVRAERARQPASPIPLSISTTPVLPRNYKQPLGPSGYVPPQRSNWGETRVSRPTPVAQPWSVNGIYVGPSPSGNWTSTSIGRPIVDVNIIGTPRQRGAKR